MQKKLAVLFVIILVAFVSLNVRLYAINRDNGDNYKKQVLSQQKYDSVVLPAKRGDILDRNGSKMAVSQKVYNVVIDAKTLNQDDGENLEPTLNALYSTNIDFTYTQSELRSFILENPGSQYRIVAKKQKYDVISGLMDILNNSADNPNVKGVWLEDTYQRQYPYNSLACDVIGFVQGDNMGSYGLEEFYNDTLNGTNGREYGYLNSDENLERTIKPAQDGHTLVTSIDVNIQSIVEKHILAFNEEHRDEYREGNGSTNTGVIIMDPNSGEILAMASYPVYDLNNPRDTSNITIDMPSINDFMSELYGIDLSNSEGDESDSENTPLSSLGLTLDTGNANNENLDSANQEGNAEVQYDENGNEIGSLSANLEEAKSRYGLPSYSQETFSKYDLTLEDAQKTPEELYLQATENMKLQALNSLWKNFCVNFTYEPGSTVKPFTMAIGLEEGILTGNENYDCGGVLEVGDHKIHCNNRLGHGPLTFSGALEQSCNVAFMRIGASIGRSIFMKYNKIYNFGLKTNVDLTGEAMTNTLVFDEKTMTPTDLAIGSFGQGFNVTMIQMISGFCSLINGGYYYQPHFVTKIQNAEGVIEETIEPRVLKQTVSEETSEKIKELCVNVVSEGTGKTARPAGYMIGGKTGTAEKLPRGTENYIVSFIGFAPADDPQIAIYTVIDEPNSKGQASAKYATVLTKDILTEVLPYLNIFQTEELTEKEAAELAEKQQIFSAGSTLEKEEPEESTEENAESNGEGGIQFIDNTSEVKTETAKPKIEYDKQTGYAIDPTTGDLLDPETGRPIDGSVSDLE